MTGRCVRACVCLRVSHEAAPHVDGRSDVESDDDDNEDGDYTVFECRGLATVSSQLRFHQIRSDHLHRLHMRLNTNAS